MANKKISDFTAATAIADADLFEIETAGGNSRKVTGLLARGTIEKKALSGLSTYTFSSIPSNFDSLELTVYSRSSTTGVGQVNVAAIVNGLTTSIYYQQRHFAEAATPGADSSLAAANWPSVIVAAAGNAITNEMGLSVLTLEGCQTATFKGMRATGFVPDLGTGAGFALNAAGFVGTTAAITSITITLASGTFSSTSYATLRGR